MNISRADTSEEGFERLIVAQMGGPRAPRTLAQGADTIVWLATLLDGGPRGGFFRDRRRIAW